MPSGTNPGNATDSAKGSGFAEQAVRSVGWNVVFLPFRYLLPLLSSVVVVRVIGAEQYGLLITLGAITGTVVLYADLGISKTIPKFEAEVRHLWGPEQLRDFIATLVGLRLALAVLVVIGIYVFAEPFLRFFRVQSHHQLYLALVSTTILAGAPTGVLRGLLVARLRTRDVNSIGLLTSVGTPLLAMGAALLGLGVPGVLGSTSVIAVLQTLCLAWATTAVVDWRGTRLLLPSAVPTNLRRRFVGFSGFTYFGLLTRYLNELPYAILLMNAFGLQAQVALLSIAYRAATLVRDLATSPLLYTLAPIFGNTYLDESHQKLRRAYPMMTRLYLWALVPATGLLLCLAEPLLVGLYGQEFSSAVQTVRWLAVLLLLSTAVSFEASILLMYERYKDVVWTSLMGSATTTLLAVLLIPRMSHLGAALAVGIGGVVWHGCGTYRIHQLYSLRYPWRFALRVALACSPMLAYFPLQGVVDGSLVGAVGFAGLTGFSFLGIFKLLGGICDEERRLIENSSLPFKRSLLRVL